MKGRFVQRRSRQNKPLFIETVELAGGVIVHEFRGDAPGELTLGEVSTVEVIRPAHAGQREEEVHRRWTEREQRLGVGQSLNGRRVLRLFPPTHPLLSKVRERKGLQVKGMVEYHLGLGHRRLVRTVGAFPTLGVVPWLTVEGRERDSFNGQIRQIKCRR